MFFTTTEMRFFTTTPEIFKDNRDNKNNGKNRRNRGCHEVTYNKDNGDYSAPDVFFYDNAWDF